MKKLHFVFTGPLMLFKSLPPESTRLYSDSFCMKLTSLLPSGLDTTKLQNLVFLALI